MAEQPDPTTPALLTAEAVGHVLSISTRQVWRLAASGQLPAPVRLGRRSRWRLAELMQWIGAGLPPRDEWARLKADSER